jgi:hypothetical protein
MNVLSGVTQVRRQKSSLPSKSLDNFHRWQFVDKRKDDLLKLYTCCLSK